MKQGRKFFENVSRNTCKFTEDTLAFMQPPQILCIASSKKNTAASYFLPHGTIRFGGLA